MISKSKIIAFSAAFVLGAVINASAATRHHRAVHTLRSYDDGVPILSNACPPVPPCRTPRNDW